MLERTYSLASHSRLEDAEGRFSLVGAYPLQVVALNESAWILLHRLRPGTPLADLLEPVDPGAVRYLEQMTAQGLLTVEYRLIPSSRTPHIDVVIPVYENPVGLSRCLAALENQTYPRERYRITVVDDGSSPPLHRSPNAHGGEVGGKESPGNFTENIAGNIAGNSLRWLRLEENRGPASARNAGAAVVANCTAGIADGTAVIADGTAGGAERDPAPILAFVDSDAVPEPGWLAHLAALLETPDLAAAAGAILPLDAKSLLGAYEGACSSLYLGEAAGPAGRPGLPISYLPSCNLGIRRAVFHELGGFREGWRFGEDVDLSWRLSDAGHGMFYHPASGVAHQYRTGAGGFLQRKRCYARSEAALRKLHPARFDPVTEKKAALGLILAGFALWSGQALPFLAGVAMVVIHAGWKFRGKLQAARPRPPSWNPAMILGAALRGGGGGLLHLARRSLRMSALFLVLGAIVIPSLWPLPATVFALGICGEWLSRHPNIPWRIFLTGTVLENLAYSLGWLEGMLGSIRVPRNHRPWVHKSSWGEGPPGNGGGGKAINSNGDAPSHAKPGPTP